MVVIVELNEAAFEEWLSTRPQIVRELAANVRPGVLYRLRDTGQRVYLRPYCEDGTVAVVVSADYNFVAVERTVFGIPPEALSECDLPSEDEMTGLASVALMGIFGRRS